MLSMPDPSEEISSVKVKIEALEIELAKAKEEIPQDRRYLINLGEQLTELRKKENILLTLEVKQFEAFGAKSCVPPAGNSYVFVIFCFKVIQCFF